MRIRFPLAIVATTTVAAVFGFSWLTSVSRSQDTPVPPAPAPADPSISGPQLPAPSDGDDKLDGAEVLTRGPVHEAFASPTLLDPQATPTIQKKPPDPIEELPPDQRPDGDDVIWIPGYWAWDDERNDFLWISGLYRNAPPNQTWVSGYWNEVKGGYQWTPGFWTSAKQESVTYLEDAPPDTLEAGPSSPAPSDDHFWVPGCWTYQDMRYAWRPGYWTVSQPNWVWVPARYQWCPSGYVFIAGYWDYLPVSRGFLFAPVYFTQPIYYQPAFVYRPAVVISTGFFSANLFCRPSFCSYYFGDYFGVQYSNVGFRPWFSVAVGIGGRPCYDPFFSYYHCHNRHHDRDWLVHAQQRYDNLRRDEHARPPHTFASFKKDKGRIDRPNRNDVAIAKTLKDVKRDGNSGNVKLHEVDRNDRDKFVKQGTELKKVAKERGDIEKVGKKTDIARTQQNVDQRRGDDGKPIVKVSDKKLKLPTVAKVDSPARNHGDTATRAIDSAKKTNNVTDNTTRTTGPRLENNDKQPTPGGDLSKKDTDQTKTAINKPTPRLGQAKTDTPRTVRPTLDNIATDLTKKRDDVPDATKKAVDRARGSTSSTNPGKTNGPALTQSDSTKRQSVGNDVSPRRPTIDTGIQSGNNAGRSQNIVTSPSNNNRVTSPRGPTTTMQPRNQTNLPYGNSDANRATRNLQPQQQAQQATPRSSPQPRIQPSNNNNTPSGGKSGTKGNESDADRSRRRSGRSADAGSPSSNIDISPDAPNLSRITRNVDEQFKADREAHDVNKDETAKRVRDVVRGAPREDTDATANNRAAPSGGLRVPSIYGPASPNERGVTQSDNGGPLLGPANGNRDADDGRRNEPRRSYANNQNDAGSRNDRNSAMPNRDLTDGVRPGRTPISGYDSLIRHGQTLSRGTTRERPGTTDDDGNVDPRKAKDPIGSIGFGSTPKRFETQQLAGQTGGQSSGGRSSAGAGRQGGSGSIDTGGLPRWQTMPRPHMPQLHRGGTSADNVPLEQKYDPNRRR